MSQQTLRAFADVTQCPTCGREDFEDKRAMRIHHKHAHGKSLAEREDRYRCPECGKEVPTKRGLSNHLAKVHKDRWEDLQDEGLVLTLADKD
ncbi:C2H2-type zinc finger protein [Halobellus inordinatus]|uniref:C2H2-type zinc finger protein n=1 Tax=Halobellus inordinatus TaxID=1126236 RepID=UPI002115AF74|nr:C2H2-type zinc finger protein [Halobellus ramosii]